MKPHFKMPHKVRGKNVIAVFTSSAILRHISHSINNHATKLLKRPASKRHFCPNSSLHFHSENYSTALPTIYNTKEFFVNYFAEYHRKSIGRAWSTVTPECSRWLAESVCEALATNELISVQMEVRLSSYPAHNTLMLNLMPLTRESECTSASFLQTTFCQYMPSAKYQWWCQLLHSTLANAPTPTPKEVKAARMP